VINKRITAARTRLFLDSPWFGSLAMRLAIVEEPSIQTFDVDGTTMRYNPVFADSLSDAEITAVIAHEVMHCALLHMYRRGTRDAQQWNEATDYAINSELVKSGFKLPQGALLDSQYAGLSADVIYARLGKKPQNNPQQSTGSVLDAPVASPNAGNGQSTAMSESDWKIAAEQATAVSKARGDMLGGIETAIKSARKDVADWKTILREFVEHTTPSDYSWLHPNRRYVAQGIYLPGVTRENLGHVAIAVDTSGSIDESLLASFSTELNGILGEAKPERVTVLYCDTKVNRVEEYTQDEEINMRAVGRGGTRFTPVFEAIAQWEVPPVCLIYFTDLDGDNPSEPDYPTLWVTSLAVTGNGPFGQTVRIAD